MSKQLIKLLAETGNTKLDKTRTDQILIAGLSLAPAMESGTELCPSRSEGCTSVCLFDQGRGKFSNVRQARIKKAQLFLENRRLFLSTLESELDAIERKAEKQGKIPFVRLNVLSDVAWELVAPSLFKRKVRFYDYTKRFDRMDRYLTGKFPWNYDLIFSRSEENESFCLDVLSSGGVVNVVWRTRESIPDTWFGYHVIKEQDDTDVWWLGKVSQVGGAFAKGSAKLDQTGFVL